MIEQLENRKLLTTEQIAILLFNGKLKVTQRRLSKLHNKGKGRIKRLQIASHLSYCYYVVDKKELIEQKEHLIFTNWVYVKLKQQLKLDEVIFHFSYEKQNEILRYDGFIGIENFKTGNRRFYFIEVDLSNNKFDKVEKYCRYYRDKLYKQDWWCNDAVGFPGVIIVTHREGLVRRRIEKENSEELEFIIWGLDFVDGIVGKLKGKS